MFRAALAALTGLSVGILGVVAMPAAGAVAAEASTGDARFEKTAWNSWRLSAFQTVNNQTLSCPANFRLDGTDYSPGRGVPRGVEVQELGGIGVTAVSLNDAAGNSIGATSISMTNWNFESHNVKIVLHCYLPETPAETPASDGRLNQPYEFTYPFGIVARAQIVEGELPPGLRMDEFGKITGTPTEAGFFTYKVYGEDDQGGLFHSDSIYIAEHTADPAAEIPAAAGVAMAPNAASDTADVLGLGYEQVIQLNGNTVEIREPQNRGGSVLRSFGTPINPLVTWNNAADTSLGSGIVGLPGMDAPVGRVAAMPGAVFVVGAVSDGMGPAFKMKLFRYGGEGTELQSRDFAFPTLPTAMSVEEGNLVVGLLNKGVRILDEKTLRDKLALHTDWDRVGLGNEVDVVTAVGVTSIPDDDGDRLVSVAGRWTDAAYNLSGSDALSGELLWNYNWHETSQDRVVPDVVEFGEYGPNGEVAVAIGWWKQNRVTILDAAGGHELSVVWGDSKATGLRFFRDVDGRNMLAIQREGTSSVGSVDEGGKWSTVVDIPPAPTNAFPYTAGKSSAQVLRESFVPGYRAGTVLVKNDTVASVSVKMFSSRDTRQGCWVGSTFAGASPWPAGQFDLGAGASSARFGTANLTGTAGCTGQRGVFFAEITDTEGGSRQVVKIGSEVNAPWKLGVLESVGEDRYVVSMTQSRSTGSVVGDWVFSVTDRFAEPGAVTAPTIVGARLTPAAVAGWVPTANVDDPSRPVFRFTVSGTQWHIPNAGDVTEVSIPAMRVEASTDGAQWAAVGTLVPPTAPSRAGETVTLGDASFDWQNVHDGPVYTQFRVISGDKVSGVVDTGVLPAPESMVNNEVNGLTLSVDAFTVASVRPNGLDQIPFRYRLTGGTNSQTLDPGDPRYAEWYDRVYFRDESKTLITGLGNPDNPGQMVSVQQQAGQFSNSATSAFRIAAANGRAAYLTTTDGLGRSIQAVFKMSGKDTITRVSQGSVKISDRRGAQVPQGTGTEGIAVSGCGEGLCELSAPRDDQPVIFSKGENMIGLQLRQIAVTGTGALPLGNGGASAAEQELIRDDVQIIGDRAYLVDPNRFGFIGMFTTTLVSHGDLVPVVNFYVKGKEAG